MMAFDDIVLVLAGLGCVFYLASKVKKAMRGEPGCSGCSGCPSSKSGCCEIQPSRQEKGKNNA